MPKQTKSRAKGAKSQRTDPSQHDQAFRSERNKRLNKERNERTKEKHAAKWHAKRTVRGTARMKQRASVLREEAA